MPGLTRMKIPRLVLLIISCGWALCSPSNEAVARIVTPGFDSSEAEFFENCPLMVAGRFLALEEIGTSAGTSHVPNAYVFGVDHVIKGTLASTNILVAIPVGMYEFGLARLREEVFPAMVKQGRYLLLLEEDPDAYKIYSHFGESRSFYFITETALGSTRAPEGDGPEWRDRLEKEFQQTIDLAPTFGNGEVRGAYREAYPLLAAVDLVRALGFDKSFVDSRIPLLLASENPAIRRAGEMWRETHGEVLELPPKSSYTEAEMIRLFGEPVDRRLPAPVAKTSSETPIRSTAPSESGVDQTVETGHGSETAVLQWYGMSIGYGVTVLEEPDFLADTSQWDWNGMTGDIQLSIRMSKNGYAFSEPVYLLVAVRNASPVLRTVIRTRPASVFKVVVTTSNGEPVPRTRYGDRFAQPSSKKARGVIAALRPGDAFGYVLALQELFDLTLSGSYVVHIETLVPLDMSAESNEWLSSNRVQFTMTGSALPGIHEFMNIAGEDSVTESNGADLNP